MSQEPRSLSEYVMSLLEKGDRKDQIEANLLEKGYDELFVKKLVKEVLELRHSKRRAAGFALILSGAVLCLLSFTLTITSSFSQGTFTMILFGLTTAGIVLAFMGLMKVF